MTDLSDLIERVEKASGPDRDLDTALLELSDADFVAQLRRGWRDFLPIRETDVAAIRSEAAYVEAHAPPYTESLDAAVALCERVLEGWAWNVGTVHFGRDGFMAEVYRNSMVIFEARAPTPALALLLAMLRAKAAA